MRTTFLTIAGVLACFSVLAIASCGTESGPPTHNGPRRVDAAPGARAPETPPVEDAPDIDTEENNTDIPPEMPGDGSVETPAIPEDDATPNTEVPQDDAPIIVPVTPESPGPIYLLHIDNQQNQLIAINVETDRRRVLCQFHRAVNYPSITFDMHGQLFGSRDGRFLDLIDPCACTITSVGPTGYTGINGITANGIKDMFLYGLSSDADTLLDIDMVDGNANPVGTGLGTDFGFSGTTWSHDIDSLLAINADNDSLYTVDPRSGIATRTHHLDVNFGSVGIEWHPGDGELYACTDQKLLRINTTNGHAEQIGRFSTSCNNLAAPWVRIACIDEQL